jgi:ribonucleoside-diphosphate reductase alpha chain
MDTSKVSLPGDAFGVLMELPNMHVRRNDMKEPVEMRSSLDNKKDDHMVPMQEASLDIWDQKYRLRNQSGDPVDVEIHDTYVRVAKALADIEKEPELWYEKFLWALNHGAIPAGRITSNAGATEYKPGTSLINCTVSQAVQDSMDGILTSVHRAGLTLKAGCGIGFEFSTLRPKGAFVKGPGATTSGPLSFMDIFDKMCFTISSAGGRRGAQMATFDVTHPDVMDFIRAKREDGRLRQFNLSLLITDEFIHAVKNDKPWPLYFPAKKYELEEAEKDDSIEIIYRSYHAHHDSYTYNEDGLVACRVYRTIPARRLWDMIMVSTYDFAEPGFILIDRVNEMNNNWFCEEIRACNPCGEQMLPYDGSCLLGSVNLTKYVRSPFTTKAYFDWAEFDEVVSIFTRMLDNVVEINGLPLKEQRHELEYKRRHGMGYLGLGSALTMLGLKYGSPKACEFTEEVSKRLAIKGFEVGVELALEKGSAPIMEDDFEITEKMMRQRPQLKADGFQVGDKVKGKVLLALYSHYFEKFPSGLLKDIAKHGCRFTHHTSIAPTGTIALSLANNASNGIEPSFSHKYFRNVIRPGKNSKEKIDVFSYELLAYRELINPDACPDSEEPVNQLPEYFVSADTITPKEHIDMQAAAQKWVDSSISKTANVPTDILFEDFMDIYLYAYEKGLKGCTTFRFNPENFQGVLVKEKDLENTTYKFTLEDGEVIEAKGNDEIEYDGETHTAANLYDALKEGYYGKF